MSRTKFKSFSTFLAFCRVENVLWRIQNGELDFHVKIKAVVLFVGTNNIDCTPHEILEGILEIIKEVKQRLGKLHIVLPVMSSLNSAFLLIQGAYLILDAVAARTVPESVQGAERPREHVYFGQVLQRGECG